MSYALHPERNRRQLAWKLLRFGAGLLCGLHLAAQQPSTPQFKITARLVQVPVTVLDARGRFLPGLRRRDFRLFVDGKPMPIVALDLMRRLPPALNSAAKWPAPLPPNAVTNLAPVGPNHVVLLFDYLRTPASALPYLQRQMSTLFTHPLPPGVDVAIFDLAAGLRVLQPFSRNQDRLRLALNRMLKSPHAFAAAGVGGGLGANAALPVFTQSIPPAGAGDFADQQASIILNRLATGNRELVVPALRYQYFHRLQLLRLLAQILGGIPGHKLVLWISTDPSFAFSIFATGADAITRAKETARLENARARESRSRNFIHLAVRNLNAANASLYFINPLGLKSYVRGAGVTGSKDGNSLHLRQMAVSYTARAVAIQAAKKTGGEALPQTNNLAALAEQAIRKIEDQYVLYFRPPFRYRAAAQYHRIRVQLLRADARIRYRQGYLQQARNFPGSAPPALSQSQPAIARQMALSPMELRGLPLAMVPGSLSAPEKPYWRGAPRQLRVRLLPFTLEIPFARLIHARPHGAGFGYNFQVAALMVSAATGEIQRMPLERFSRKLSFRRAAVLRSREIRYSGRFVLGLKGSYLCRALVEDKISGQIGSVSLIVRADGNEPFP